MGPMKWRGFTLIEMIVVVSIVATLGAVLMPALHGVRAQARSTVCQTHIRSLLLELQQYSQAQDGILPYSVEFGQAPGPPWGYAGTPVRDAPSWWWFDRLEQVNRSCLRESGIIECPSKRLDGRTLTQDELWGNYGVNSALCVRTQGEGPNRPPRDRPRSIHEVRHPGSTLLIVDGGYAVASWTQAADEPPALRDGMVIGTPYIPGLDINKDRQLEPEVIDDAVRGRHPGKTANVGFVDGHLEHKQANELLVRKTGEDSYANLRPLWEQ